MAYKGIFEQITNEAGSLENKDSSNKNSPNSSQNLNFSNLESGNSVLNVIILTQQLDSFIKIAKIGYQAVNQGNMAINNAHQSIKTLLEVLTRSKHIMSQNIFALEYCNQPKESSVDLFIFICEIINNGVDVINMGNESLEYASELISEGYGITMEFSSYLDCINETELPILEVLSTCFQYPESFTEELSKLDNYIKLAGINYQKINESHIKINETNQNYRFWSKKINRQIKKFHEPAEVLSYPLPEFDMNRLGSILITISSVIRYFKSGVELVNICYNLIKEEHIFFRQFSDILGLKKLLQKDSVGNDSKITDNNQSKYSLNLDKDNSEQIF